MAEECEEVNANEGCDFDVTESVQAQIPFFTCSNHLLDANYQEDIKRYLYCTEVNIPPYEGSYNEQPYKWIEKFFIIKKALAKREKRMLDKSKTKGKKNG